MASTGPYANLHIAHHSVFYRPDALPAAQPTVSKHWRNTWQWVLIKTIWLCKNLWHNWTVNDTDLWQIEYAVHVWFHSVVVAELLLRLPCHLACISWNSLPSCGHFPLHNSGRICFVSFFFWLYVLLLLNFRLSVQDIVQQPSSWLWKCLTVLIFLLFCDPVGAPHAYEKQEVGKPSRNAAQPCAVYDDPYGPITIAIRARFEYDSTTIRLQHATRCVRFDYDSSTIQHPTRSYVLSSNNEHVNSFALL